MSIRADLIRRGVIVDIAKAFGAGHRLLSLEPPFARRQLYTLRVRIHTPGSWTVTYVRTVRI
jgi:hypothetical protein